MPSFACEEEEFIETRLDAESGYYYYYDTRTGECSWASYEEEEDVYYNDDRQQNNDSSNPDSEQQQQQYQLTDGDIADDGQERIEQNDVENKKKSTTALEAKLLVLEQARKQKELEEQAEREKERARMLDIRLERQRQQALIQNRVTFKNKLEQKYASKLRRHDKKWIANEKMLLCQQRKDRLEKIEKENSAYLNQLATGEKIIRNDSIRVASLNGDAERVLELVRLGNDVNSQSAMGLTPLLAACQKGSYDTVKILLEHGALVNHRRVKTLRSGYMEACARNNVGIVRELLRFGAYLNLKDAQGNTAYDGILDSTVKRIHNMATKLWCPENAFLFPKDFREATLAIALCELRRKKNQKLDFKRTSQDVIEKVLQMKAQIVENKVQYDIRMKAAGMEITLLKQVDKSCLADSDFDDNKRHILQQAHELNQKLIMSQNAVHLPTSILCQIFSYCPRHWFDQKDGQGVRIDHGNLRFPPKGTCKILIQPTRWCLPSFTLPESLQRRWTDISLQIQTLYDNLKKVNLEQVIDRNTNVARLQDGKSMAKLDIVVSEGKNLPKKTNRAARNEPIDPIVKISVDLHNDKIICKTDDITDKVKQEVWSEPRFFDANPVWDQELCIQPIEGTNGRIFIKLYDNQNDIAGEFFVELRTLLDQKEHDVWYTLKPTLKHQILEGPREHPAQLRIILKFTYNVSLVLTKELKKTMKERGKILSEIREFLQNQTNTKFDHIDRNCIAL